MKRLILMFTGQGSHHPEMFSTMKHSLLNAPIAINILGDNYIDKLKNTPEPLPTSFTQPLILMHSVILYQELLSHLENKLEIKIACGLGHSLGEFSAITCAGGYKFEDAMHLVHQRGLLMEQQVSNFAGQVGMVALINCSRFDYEGFISKQEDLFCDIANMNSEGQVVLSGSRPDVDEAVKRLRNAGATFRVVLLRKVAAPFHSRLMKPVSDQLHQSFIKYLAEDKKLAFPIITNFDAKIVETTHALINSSIYQTHSTVRWSDSINKACEVSNSEVHFVEIGPSKTLSSFLPPNTTSSYIGQPSDITHLLKSI